MLETSHQLSLDSEGRIPGVWGSFLHVGRKLSRRLAASVRKISCTMRLTQLASVLWADSSQARSAETGMMPSIATLCEDMASISDGLAVRGEGVVPLSVRQYLYDLQSAIGSTAICCVLFVKTHAFMPA